MYQTGILLLQKSHFTVTSRKLVLPSKLTEVSEVVMILINMVVIISPPIIHTTPRSLPGIVFGALSPYLKKDTF